MVDTFRPVQLMVHRARVVERCIHKSHNLQKAIMLSKLYVWKIRAVLVIILHVPRYFAACWYERTCTVHSKTLIHLHITHKIAMMMSRRFLPSLSVFLPNGQLSRQVASVQPAFTGSTSHSQILQPRLSRAYVWQLVQQFDQPDIQKKECLYVFACK